MNIPPYLSVVSPVYGSKASLNPLYSRLVATLAQITDNFEIILVNDGCPQSSWETITEICNKDRRVRGINLSKNYGQHHAITAGLDHASGDWVVVMDCDLQDQPEEIIKLHAKALEGFDIVFGQRIDRRDSTLKKMGSKIYRSVFNYLSGTDRDPTQANYGIFSRRVIASVNLHREQTRVFPAIVSLVGFSKAAIPIAHGARYEGRSGYDLRRLIKLAIDTSVAHSNKPLMICIQIGFIFATVSALVGAWLTVRYALHAIPVPGWTSIMVALFFLFGLMFAMLGIVGLYIGKVFDEVKQRPLYIVSEKRNVT